MGFKSQLNTSDFERLIQTYGEPVARYLRKVGPCPNPLHGDVLSPGKPGDRSCPLCTGTKEVFEELNVSEISDQSPCAGKVVFQMATSSRRRVPVEKTTARGQLSYLPQDYPCQDGDRMVFTTRDDFHRELFVWDEDHDGAASHPLRYWPALEVASVYAGAVKLSSGYGLTSDGRGITLTGVAAGTSVLALYRYRSQWVISPGESLDRVAADNGDRFPNRVTLFKWQGYGTDVAEGQE